MTTELMAALIIALLLPINAIAASLSTTLVTGLKWGLGNRESTPELKDWMIRFKKSHLNLLENAPSFLAIVLIAHVLNIHSSLTEIGAWTFVISRVIYIFLYTFGITFMAIRTLAFFASLIGMLTIVCEIIKATS